MFITGKETAELRDSDGIRQKNPDVFITNRQDFQKKRSVPTHYSSLPGLCLSIDARVPYIILSSWALMSALA